LSRALAAAGMDEAAIAAEVARRSPEPADTVELEADDEGIAASLFLALDTQWNWTAAPMVAGNGGFGVRTGLKYESIAPTAAALEITVDRQVMIDLKVLEAQALATFAEARG
jgi:hypothetical protein